MSSLCKGICSYDKKHEFVTNNWIRYNNNIKRCTKCDKNYKTDSVKCFCCLNILRSSSRVKK